MLRSGGPSVPFVFVSGKELTLLTVDKEYDGENVDKIIEEGVVSRLLPTNTSDSSGKAENEVRLDEIEFQARWSSPWDVNILYIEVVSGVLNVVKLFDSPLGNSSLDPLDFGNMSDTLCDQPTATVTGESLDRFIAAIVASIGLLWTFHRIQLSLIIHICESFSIFNNTFFNVM